MNNNFKVEGIITGISKKGNTYTMLQLTRPFAGNTNSQTRVGREVLSQYVEGNVSSDIKVGCEVQFDYTINSSGYPTVCGVKLAK